MRNGSVISGNGYDDVWIYKGTFSMSGGTIRGNTAHENGGGVSNMGGRFTMIGRFIKTGGTVDGTNNATMEGKIAFAFLGKGGKGVRNSAAGPSVNIDSEVSGRQGGW